MLKVLNANKQHYRETMQLGFPVILAQAGQIMVGVVDNIMLGYLGKTQLAAASFANTLFILLLLFTMGFASALTPLAGEEFGRKNYRKIGFILLNGLVANGLASLLLLGLATITYFLMPYMGQPENIIGMSQDYFLILLASVPFFSIFLTGKQIAEAMANTRSAMRITLIANVINVIGNYLFIYGKFGCPKLELLGAGIGTFASRVFMCFAFIYIFLKRSDFRKILWFASKTKIALKELKNIFKIGVPLGIQTVTEAAAFGLTTIMMGWLGETALAAHQITFSISSLGYMIYQGIGVSTTIRISNFIGQSKFKEIRPASQASVHLTLALVVIISSLLLLFRFQLPYIFTQDSAVAELSSTFIIFLIIYQVFDASQIIFSGVLRGMSDVKIPSLLTFICYFIIAVPFSYFMAFILDFKEIGIWFGLPVGLSLCAILFYFRVKKQTVNSLKFSKIRN